jgi:hypothetical protein
MVMMSLKDSANKLRVVVILVLTAGTLVVAGCGQGSGGGPSGGIPSSAARHRINGVIYGGQNAIIGATVTLYAAASDGFGSSDVTVLGTAITDSSGNYTLNSGACPLNSATARPKIQAADIEGDTTAETYIVATGGNSGSGVSNAAIALMAAIGPCDKIQDSTKVVINELTTIAAQWALQQFADSSGKNIGAPSNQPNDLGGLANAYDTIFNLADQNPTDLSVSGNPAGFLPSAAQCGAGSPPVNCDGLERLDTIADIIAACVNTSGPTSTACKTLFCDATPGATFSGGNCSASPTITNTLEAAHSLAQNPTHNVGSLFALATPNAPFQPTLGPAPDGWEIALNYAPSGAGFHNLGSLALDGSGNVFVTNLKDSNSVSELTVASSYTTGLNFAPAGANFDIPYSLALDGSGNVFVANEGNSVSELTVASSYTTGLNFAPAGAAFDIPYSLALDQSGNVFVTNFNGNSVSELTQASSYSTGLNFAPAAANFNEPIALTLDQAGNLFVANRNGDSVSELTLASGYSTGFNFAPAGAALDQPVSLSMDRSGNLFAANLQGNSVSALRQSSGYSTGFKLAPAGAAFNQPQGLAVDGAGNIFVANGLGNSVSELTVASSYATGLNFAPAGAAFNDPTSTAIDGSGNLFVANFSGDSVSELIGLATPVTTPLSESAGGAGRAGAAIIVFLTLLTFWYGRKYRSALVRRTA